MTTKVQKKITKTRLREKSKHEDRKARRHEGGKNTELNKICKKNRKKVQVTDLRQHGDFS